MKSHRAGLACAAIASAFLASCSGGTPPATEPKTGGDFTVLDTSPQNGGEVYLNDAIRVRCSNDVDLDSASLTTMSFQAIDSLGQPRTELVSGTFRLGGNARELLFVPRLPDDDAYLQGGFRPERRYVVQLVGGDADNGTVLRDRGGKGLVAPYSFTFHTRSGTQPAQLFRNPKPGGPARTGLDVSTAASLDAVPLAAFGAPPLEVRLHFDQALNPASANVPVRLDTDPLVRDESQRGRVFLEYADPDDAPGEFTWIPADVELERNDDTGATVVLRPVGVLPNNATVRVIAEATLEDIAGESSVGATTFERVFGTFRTAAAWEQQWNGIVEQFAAGTHLDPGAVFGEPMAEVGPGHLRAGFQFEGNTTTRDYAPTAVETVLNTAFTQVVPTAGLPFTVSGGVFTFRNMTIQAGTTVAGQGPNPMVFLCSGKVKVAGTLSVRGGDGTRVNTLSSANFTKAGGIGGCGGGNGGDGTPSATQRDMRGATGRGPLQAVGRGGRGGFFACAGNCYTGNGFAGSGGGSGGGGGTMATQGDPNHRGTFVPGLVPNTAPTANTNFQQRRGFGGSGCGGGSGTRSAFLLGGEPGDLVFTDTRADNNFWGSAVDLSRNLRITGELAVPVGGGGGGGGGDTQSFGDPVCGPNPAVPAADYSGGGGGGGGGVLIIKALDEIWITSSGRVVADGGHGGGGEQAGSSGEAGGGGGGAGGMVVLMSARGIRIEAHGNVAQNRFVYGDGSNGPLGGNEYSFAISADGGVSTTGTFATTGGAFVITSKYPALGAPMMPGNDYDTNPLGGLGGMGIVQLMVPPGDNSDGTNTVLDDNIHFYLPGQLDQLVLPAPLGAAAKRQLLAWRGFPNQSGVPVDDAGQPTAIGNNEGDIRPSPTLLPVPFGAKSRARSRWIDTGSSHRRALPAPDDLARGLVVGNGAEVGPRFEFAGIDGATGYAQWQPVGAAGVRVDTPIVVPNAALASVSEGTFLGARAYRLQLAAPVLGTDNRYVQYDAEVLNAGGAVLAGFRILAHDERELLVDPGRELLPQDAALVRIAARFFGIVTDGSSGLPSRLPLGASTAVPAANVGIGFAFHTDPNSTTPLVGRFPASSEQAFVHDLEDPALQTWLAANHPRYVMWDVVFDLTYDAGAGSPPLSADARRPELHFLRLPFRW